MSRRLTNSVLLVATLVLVATGLIAWAIPESKATFLYDIHRVTGVGLVLALGAITLVVGVAAEHVPGGRRITGSKHAGSFTANDMPLTIWTFDQIPAIDPRAWRLELRGSVADRAPVDMDALLAGPLREVDAVIDCTGGWWSEQRWRGRPLLDLLASRGMVASARSVTVTSVTGHSWSYPVDDLADAILATHIGGEPLSAGHGAPVRLVVPGRRGFQWIKWVGRVEVS